MPNVMNVTYAMLWLTNTPVQWHTLMSWNVQSSNRPLLLHSYHVVCCLTYATTSLVPRPGRPDFILQPWRKLLLFHIADWKTYALWSYACLKFENRHEYCPHSDINNGKSVEKIFYLQLRVKIWAEAWE